MRLIDNFLNTTTMYRLLLYFLTVLLLLAVFESFFGLLPFSPLDILFSTAFIIAISFVTNTIFAKAFKAPTNIESVYITALILALIITPTFKNLSILIGAPLIANISKYIVATNKKHIFNPAAFGVFITSIALGQYASWWIGTPPMFPLVLLGGALLIRKINRTYLVLSFLLTTFLISLGVSSFQGMDVFAIAKSLIIESPLLFFAFVMLTEPLTTPPIKKLQIIYGALIGLLFSPQFRLLNLSTTPESSLLIGNLFSYFVSLKFRPILKLKEKIELGSNLFEFVFTPNQKLNFLPGQYLEWTLAHEKPDSRGNRRFFTIASSPTEDKILAGIKFYPNSSTFKKALFELPKDGKIVATSLLGDFTLPSDKNKKLVFIAGGIGITPFRSMVKYLLDKKKKRDIVLFYSAKPGEFVFKDIFDKAKKELGVKVIYKKGRIDEEILKKKVPDLKERLFYISGPLNMITSFKKTLKKLGVKESHIITDYFPGFNS